MSTVEAAQRYCGKVGPAWRACGDAQLAILRDAGGAPSDDVLEIGAGALSGTRALLEFLEPGRLVVLEPNAWLVRAALEDPALAALAKRKHLRVLYREDFDASATGRAFRWIFSHSVLSHAAHWQAARMLVAARRVLAPGGDVIASLRLRETPSYDTAWQYPGNSWFSLASVEALAAACGFAVERRPRWQAIMVAACPTSVHDWLRFRLLP